MMVDLRKKPDLSTVESDIKALTAASKSLNNVTDQLTEQVTQIESVINALNLGLDAFVVVRSYTNDHEPWSSSVLRLSYGKSEGRWGFEVEEFDHDERDDEVHNYKSWAFKDAPRLLRLEVVNTIPELIKEMVKEAEVAAARVTEKLDDAKAIASTVFKPTLDGAVRK